MLTGVVSATEAPAAEVTAEEQPEPASWSELLAEVEEALLGLEPRIAEIESYETPMSDGEEEELREIYRRLDPAVTELRKRKEEATEAEREEAKEAREIFRRLQALLQDTRSFAAPEEAKNAPQIERMITNFAVYGSLRGRAFVTRGNGATFDDGTTRVGIRGRVDLGKDYNFFGRYEAGTNIVSEAGRYLIGGDPGTEEDREGVAFPLRLFFAGFEGPAGRVSFGKQWSVYYDVGVFTDQAPFFGGSAQGTYNAGTDGGISGTGRANRALQYRYSLQKFKFGLQAQIRPDSDQGDRVFDTYGGSVLFRLKEKVYLGAAFSSVRDGVPDPVDDEAKKGDQSAIFGFRWTHPDDDLYFALTYATFEQHEKDDLDRFFDGAGWEIYTEYDVTKRIAVGAFWNHQKPSGDHHGDFKLDFITVGASYTIPENWIFYLMYKFENSRTSEGAPLGENTLGAAVFYNFSKGFSLF